MYFRNFKNCKKKINFNGILKQPTRDVNEPRSRQVWKFFLALGSRVWRMSPKLGLKYALCWERRKACDWPTLEAV